MEGQISHNDPMQMIALNFGGNVANDVSQAPGDDPSQQVIMAGGRTANQTNALSSPRWNQPPKLSHNYVEYLAESSTFFPDAPCEDVLESIPSSFTGIHAVGGVSEYQRDTKLTDFSMDTDAWKQVSLLRPYEEPVNTQHQIHAQYHTSKPENSNGDGSVSQFDTRPRATISAPGFLSQPCHNVSKQRTLTSDRRRRMRIAERLDALQELLPESPEGGQVCVLDDVIDLIKFLQLQLKDLCRSRLGVESITDPIIFREGYGHYFCHQHMVNDPLEEAIGKLLESNPLAANQLLENKGLLLLPMDYSEYLA